MQHSRNRLAALLVALWLPASVVAQGQSGGNRPLPDLKAETQSLALPGTDRTDIGPSVQNTRLVTFHYDPNVSFAIRSRVGLFTNIEVPEGETITGFFLSDEAMWQWHVAADKRRVLVRPNAAGEVNTATLVTNARTYELTFLSVGAGEVWHQRVRWLIPGASRPAGAGIWTAEGAEGALMLDMANVHLDYRIGTSRREATQLAPSAIFDDGTRTYFQFGARQDIPAIFASDAKFSRMDVVEFAIRGGYVVVPHVSDYWVLMLGRDRITVSRQGARVRR
jgi:type IV secretion system protein VirB9